MTLVFIGKGLLLRGLTFKNRGHWGKLRINNPKATKLGDEIRPSYVGILMSRYKDPGSLLNNKYFMESKMFFVAQMKN